MTKQQILDEIVSGESRGAATRVLAVRARLSLDGDTRLMGGLELELRAFCRKLGHILSSGDAEAIAVFVSDNGLTRLGR